MLPFLNDSAFPFDHRCLFVHLLFRHVFGVPSMATLGKGEGARASIVMQK